MLYEVITLVLLIKIMRSGLDGFLNFSGSETAGTDFDGLLLTIQKRLHLHEIRFPNPSGFVMGMTDIVACNRTFSAYITFTSHYIPTLRLYTGLVTYQNFKFM